MRQCQQDFRLSQGKSCFLVLIIKAYNYIFNLKISIGFDAGRSPRRPIVKPRPVYPWLYSILRAIAAGQKNLAP
jgi:hypothetical protein